MINDNERQAGFADPGFGMYPDDDFEGLWEVFWPNGQLRFAGRYKKGQKAVGQHLHFWDNGTLAEICSWDNGFAYGVEMKFREDGSKESEKDYGEYGGRTSSWTERSYDTTNSQLIMVTVVSSNKLVAEWTRPDMRELFDQIGLDKSINEAVKRLYPDE